MVNLGVIFVAKNTQLLRYCRNMLLVSEKQARIISNSDQIEQIKLELGVLALLDCVELVLAVGDLVVVEFQAFDEVVVFDLALVGLGWLLAGLVLLSLLWRSLGVGVSSHDSSDRLVSDFASSSEGHSLDQGAHQSTAHAS